MHETPRSPSPRHTVASRIGLTLIVLLTAICIALPLFAGASGVDVLIPAVARDSDSAGESPRSTLSLTNLGGSPATITVFLHRLDVSEQVPETATVHLSAGETRRYDDALRTLFGTGGAAALRVVADANVAVRSGATALASSSIGTGQTARVPPVTGVPGSLSVVETAGSGVFVRFTLRDIGDKELGSLESPVRPHEAKTWRVSDVLPGTGLSAGSRVEATVLAGPGRVVIFAGQGASTRQAGSLAAVRGVGR